MTLARLLLIVAVLLSASFGRSAMADIVILEGLLCADPSAVDPAINTDDLKELALLGCTMRKPYSLGFRVLRCEPRGMAVSRKSFSHRIRRDAALPYGVCEVEAILAGGQVVTAYTDYFLIFPWSGAQLTVPKFQGPQEQ